jgi:peptide chain release factor 3
MFERGTDHGSSRVAAKAIEGNQLDDLIGEYASRTLREELELLEGAGESFDRGKFLEGEITPVFFGSALTNFGVEPFLNWFGEMAPTPTPRATTLGTRSPNEDKFSGFVFKIQANMDKNHRDRVAFLRVVSGRFERGMQARLVRDQKDIRLGNAITFFAEERVQLDEGFAGDIIGLYDPGIYQIADTLTEGESFEFDGIPRFCPELFARVLVPNPLKRKRLDKGLQQLSEEGTIQVLYPPDKTTGADCILAAVGQLQFEVVQHRMLEEYDVEIRLERLGFTAARWLDVPEYFEWRKMVRSGISDVFVDPRGRLLAVFRDEWTLQYAIRNHEGVVFRAVAPLPKPGR